MKMNRLVRDGVDLIASYEEWCLVESLPEWLRDFVQAGRALRDSCREELCGKSKPNWFPGAIDIEKFSYSRLRKPDGDFSETELEIDSDLNQLRVFNDLLNRLDGQLKKGEQDAWEQWMNDVRGNADFIPWVRAERDFQEVFLEERSGGFLPASDFFLKMVAEALIAGRSFSIPEDIWDTSHDFPSIIIPKDLNGSNRILYYRALFIYPEIVKLEALRLIFNRIVKIDEWVQRSRYPQLYKSRRELLAKIREIRARMEEAELDEVMGEAAFAEATMALGEACLGLQNGELYKRKFEAKDIGWGRSERRSLDRPEIHSFLTLFDTLRSRIEWHVLTHHSRPLVELCAMHGLPGKVEDLQDRVNKRLSILLGSDLILYPKGVKEMIYGMRDQVDSTSKRETEDAYLNGHHSPEIVTLLAVRVLLEELQELIDKNEHLRASAELPKQALSLMPRAGRLTVTPPKEDVGLEEIGEDD